MITDGNFNLALLWIRLGLVLSVLGVAVSLAAPANLALGLHVLTQALLIGGLGLAMVSPLQTRVRAALGGAAFTLAWIQPAQIYFLAGLPRLLTPGCWLPVVVGLFLLMLAMSWAAQQKEQPELARRMKRLAWGPPSIVVGIVALFLLLMCGLFLLKIPSGLVAFFLSLSVTAPILFTLLAVWLLISSASMGQLQQAAHSSPAHWPLALTLLLVVGGWKSLGVRSWQMMAESQKRMAGLTRPAPARVRKLNWIDLNSRFDSSLGVVEVEPGSGFALGTADNLLKARLGAVKAGRYWLFIVDRGELRGSYCNQVNLLGGGTLDDPLRLYNNADVNRFCRSIHSDKPDGKTFLAQSYRLACKPQELGRCLAWDTPSLSPLQISLWVAYPGAIKPDMLLARCQLEVLAYAEKKPVSITLHAGQRVGRRGWKPLQSVCYTDTGAKKRPPYNDSDVPDWKLEPCKALAPSQSLLLQQEFHATRPTPRALDATPQTNAICAGRLKLLAQARLQYSRDHGGQAPTSGWQLVPDYLDSLPTCPLNEHWEYIYEPRPKEGDLLDCPVVHRRDGRTYDMTLFMKDHPELEECLKHPKGWLKAH